MRMLICIPCMYSRLSGTASIARYLARTHDATSTSTHLYGSTPLDATHIDFFIDMARVLHDKVCDMLLCIDGVCACTVMGCVMLRAALCIDVLGMMHTCQCITCRMLHVLYRMASVPISTCSTHTSPHVPHSWDMMSRLPISSVGMPSYPIHVGSPSPSKPPHIHRRKFSCNT